MSTKIITLPQSVQQFYQNAEVLESKLSNLSLAPFDSECENQYQKVQELFLKALPTLKDQPIEEQKLKTRNLKIQLLHLMLEQRDFQGLLIATVAATSYTKPSDGNNNTGSGGKVSYNDKENIERIAKLKERVSDDTFEINFS